MRGRTQRGGHRRRGVAAAAEFAVLLAGLLVAASPAAAGTLAVSKLAAAPGGGDANGLVVELVANCPFPDDVTLDSPPEIQGEFGACSNLTASGVTAVGPTVLEAGQQVVLGNDFAVTAAAELTVRNAPPSSRLAWLEDDSPDVETSFGASWELNLDPATLGAGDLLAVLTGLSAAGDTELEVLLKRNAMAMEDRLVLRTRLDDGSTADTEATMQELVLPAGWHTVAVVWAAGAGTGYFQASIDGGVFSGLSGLDNDRSRLETVRFGAAGGTAGATTGSYFLDEYVSYR